jgi:hypothetical protein
MAKFLWHGSLRLKTVVLLTAEDLDEAARRAYEYQAPGARRT